MIYLLVSFQIDMNKIVEVKKNYAQLQWNIEQKCHILKGANSIKIYCVIYISKE